MYIVCYTPTQTPTPSSSSSHNISFFHSRAFAQFIRIYSNKNSAIIFHFSRKKINSIQLQRKCGKKKSTQTHMKNLKTNYCYPMYIIIASFRQVLDAKMHHCDASMKDIYQFF